MTEDATEPIDCAAVFVVRDIEASLVYYQDARDFDVVGIDTARILVDAGNERAAEAGVHRPTFQAGDACASHGRRASSVG